MDAFLAALAHGADAVYLGGASFNARMGADNFTKAQIREAIELAHPLDARVYLTMNTLLTDDELPAALADAAAYYEMGADALIVQDLGLAALVRRHMPDFPLHLSTQGTVYNRSGAEAAARLGFKRVVLARECALETIRDVAGLGRIETEVFVHGALCICYSGQCHLSRVLGGRSANKGQCAQPCRLPYRDEKGQVGYHLSPRDLCGLDLLPDLSAAGVTSLKIEGRMKTAAYVGTVTGVYRKYLDQLRDRRTLEIDPEDRARLLQAFNRGGFTQGYFHGVPREDFLSGPLPKNTGVPVGSVQGPAKGAGLLDIASDAPLALGDGIEIHGHQVVSNVLTYLEPLPGGRLRIGDFKGPIPPGSPVYRTSSKAMSRAIQESVHALTARNLRATPVDMDFFAGPDMPAVLTLRQGARKITVESPGLCESARTRPAEAETLRRQLAKTGGTPFRPGRIHVVLLPDTALPLSAVNELRRQALEELLRQKTQGRPAPELPMDFPPPLSELLEAEPETPPLALPAILPEMPELPRPEAGGPRAVLANSLAWIPEFLAEGRTVYAGPGLNLQNGAAAQALNALGVRPLYPSYEERTENLPLMTLARPLSTRTLTDRKGRTFRVVRASLGGAWELREE